ncbi:Thioredoxin-related transmembrane protein [Dirofilaria immitis]
MENGRCKRSSQNKHKIKRNKSSAKRKECGMAQRTSNIVTEQQINNNISQGNDPKTIQGASSVTESTLSTIIDNQRSSKHIPTFSLFPDTAPIAIVPGASSMISNASNIVKQTSNKAPRIPLEVTREVSSNQKQNRPTKDASGNEVAEDEMGEQIPAAVPNFQNKSNKFRTPLNSPRICSKYYSNLLMAPKKPSRSRRYMMTKAAGDAVI